MLSCLGKMLSRRYFDHPIFVTGPSRSGTSVLLQALGRHPLIHAMDGEAPFLTSIGGAAWLFHFGESSDYYLRSLRYPETYLHDTLRRVAFEYAAGRGYGVRPVLRRLARLDFTVLEKRYWCAKTFPDEKVCRGLERLYPSVRFVCILRNGCDVVHSMTRYGGFRRGRFEELCSQWVRSVLRSSLFLRLPNAVQVRHETMVTDPDAFFSELFQQLDMDPHEDPVRFVERNLVHPLDEPGKTGVDARRELRNRPPAHEAWSPTQRETFKRICGEKMLELGYEVPF